MANLGTVTRGDTEVINLTIKNANNTARDITTDSLKFTIKKSTYDATYILQKTVGTGVPGTAVPAGSVVKQTQSGGTLGLADVTISPADLTTLGRDMTLFCDVEVTDSTGRVATTLHTLNFVLDIS